MEKRLIDYDDLTRSQKIDHIWEYYKFHFIAGGLAILLVFMMLNHYIFNPPAETTLDVSVFGMYSQAEVLEELELALNGVIVKDGENEETVVDFFSIDEEQDHNTQQAMVTKMIGKATLHDFDIMVFEGEFYQNYLQEDTLLPLNDWIDSGIINVDPSLLKKGSDLDYPSESVYLIDVSDHEGFRRMLNTDDTIYLGIFRISDHQEHIIEAIDYVLNVFK